MLLKIPALLLLCIVVAIIAIVLIAMFAAGIFKAAADRNDTSTESQHMQDELEKYKR